MPAPLERLLTALAWLRDPALEVSVVGSVALAEACRRAKLPLPPPAHDLDLAWRLTPAEGLDFLRARGIECSQTEGALERGTLGMRSSGLRIEITSYRAGGESAEERIARDAERRDMSIGALFLELSSDQIHDPMGGLEDWRLGCIRACGDARERIREHPLRALRYLRRAGELGFWVEHRTRLAIRQESVSAVASMLPEAIAEEIRRALQCSSPGVFFALAAEEGLLQQFLPELAALFDGRLAGRLQWHPEMSQGLHSILSLKAAASLAERDRLDPATRQRLILAVLFHDLGKGLTTMDVLPSHPGHEAGGVPLVDAIFERLPGLGDKRSRRLCRVVARNHLSLAKLRELRAGTLVEAWERDFAALREDYPLMAAAVRADQDGRLSPEDLGLPSRPGNEFDAGKLERRVLGDLRLLDACLREVSGSEAAARFPADPKALRAHLHEQRCRHLHAAGFRFADQRP